MNWRNGIEAWLLAWWFLQAVHLATLYGTRSFGPGLEFLTYLTALLLGRVAFVAARDALVRWRQSRDAQAIATQAYGGEGPQGAVRS